VEFSSSIPAVDAAPVTDCLTGVKAESPAVEGLR